MLIFNGLSLYLAVKAAELALCMLCLWFKLHICYLKCVDKI